MPELVTRARRNFEGLEIRSVVITVVDSAAQVVMTYRMENALLVSNDMAYEAYTAVGMKMQSKDLAPLTQPGQWLYQLETMTDNKVVSFSRWHSYLLPVRDDWRYRRQRRKF